MTNRQVFRDLLKLKNEDQRNFLQNYSAKSRHIIEKKQNSSERSRRLMNSTRPRQKSLKRKGFAINTNASDMQ